MQLAFGAWGAVTGTYGAATGVYEWWTTPSVNPKDRMDSALLALFEWARLELEERRDTTMVKYHFARYSMDRIPYSVWSSVTRTFSGQSRVDTENAYWIAARVVALYPCTDADETLGERNIEAIRFLYEKAIAGLQIYKDTYIKSVNAKPQSRMAVQNIEKAIAILQGALEGKEQSEDVKKLIAEQKDHVEHVKKRSWLESTGTEKTSKLCTRVELMKLAYQYKGDDATSKDFQDERTTLFTILDQDKKTYVESFKAPS